MGFQRANIILVERVDIRGAFTGQKTSIERIEAVFYMGWKIIIGEIPIQYPERAYHNPIQRILSLFLCAMIGAHPFGKR